MSRVRRTHDGAPELRDTGERAARPGAPDVDGSVLRPALEVPAVHQIRQVHRVVGVQVAQLDASKPAQRPRRTAPSDVGERQLPGHPLPRVDQMDASVDDQR